MDISIRIAGEAGQGLVSMGDMLSGALAANALEVFSGKGYMSRIRGGLNWYDIRIGDSPLFSLREKVDMLVALNPVALEVLKGETVPGCVVLLNGKKSDDSLTIDFAAIAEKAGGSAVMGNAVAAGAVFALLHYPLEKLCAYLEKEFSGKGDKTIELNRQCAAAGYEAAGSREVNLQVPQPRSKHNTVTAGAAAIGLGAAVSGVKVLAAYPMTPATATLNFLAAHADDYHIMVEQAEDEIAAVNMICGAVYAGVPAMTMTSGGGFSLMCEGLSLAGMVELPVFILIAQRPGPATGMPTRTAQEDLKFAVSAGHGEFPRAVFAPGTVEQCYRLTRHALETAHRFQTPVIMLTDQYLQDVKQSMAELNSKYDPIDRHVGTRKTTGYQRYENAGDGISPRAVPGGGALVVCDSDEHFENGHLTEDFASRIMQQNKRMTKVAGLEDAFIEPELYGDIESDLCIVCWGSSYGACREYVDILNADKKSACMLHFSQLWPLPVRKFATMLDKPRKVVVAESNFSGQLLSLLREAGITREMGKISRYDGLPLSCDYLIREVEL